MKHPLWLTLALSAAVWASPAPQHRDVPYDTQSKAQKLDLYLPEGPGPFPLIISIHGGAFRMGSKDDRQKDPMLAGLPRGWAVASVEYRLSGEAKFPAAVVDVKTAIRYLRAHADSLRLDPARFVTWGGSAGGHLATLVGVSAGAEPFQGTRWTQTSDSVTAVVDWFGPIRFDRMDAHFAASGQKPRMGPTSSSRSPESMWLGRTVGTPEADSLVRLASPLSWLDAKDPPVLIQHGDADPLVPVGQSRELADSLAAVAGADRVQLEILPGAGHGTEEFRSEANLAKVFQFLERTTGHSAP